VTDTIFSTFKTPSLTVGTDPPPPTVDYLINFVNKLDPNDPSNPTLLAWPKWDNTNGSPAMMTFLDRPLGGINGLAITSDTYRKAAMDYLIKLTRKYPI
jgi:hypothetical protein